MSDAINSAEDRSTTSASIHFDPARSVISVGDRRIVFHCHHYNVTLQRTLDEGLGPDAAEIQQRAAMEASRAALVAIGKGLTPAGELFGALGFGRANTSELGASGGRVILPTSHYAIGWRAKFDRSPRPVCHFAVGFWAAATSVAFDLPPERVLAREVSCSACGDAPCEIAIEVL
jgi:hypothetical protein